MSAPPGPAEAAAIATTYSSSGSTTYQVPEGVCSITVLAVGGGGGSGFARDFASPFLSRQAGGRGASVSAQVPVAPGDVLVVEVAGAGGDASDSGTPGDGGIGGGSPGASGRINTDNEAAGGGGGGASSVTTSAGERLVVAGGGGGGGVYPGADAGSAGPDAYFTTLVGGNGGGFPANPGHNYDGGTSATSAEAVDVSSAPTSDPPVVTITADTDAPTCALVLSPRFTG